MPENTESMQRFVVDLLSWVTGSAWPKSEKRRSVEVLPRWHITKNDMRLLPEHALEGACFQIHNYQSYKKQTLAFLTFICSHWISHWIKQRSLGHGS